TPLWPAGHLPLKGGDWLSLTLRFFLQRRRSKQGVDEKVISPLEGEMSGRTEGGRSNRKIAKTAKLTTAASCNPLPARRGRPRSWSC
ncbi:MAG: hypothetical protein E5X63_46255, partial [Mesorhizobium sp.]